MASNAQINSPKLWQKHLPTAKSFDNKYTRGHLLINGSALECTGATKLAAFAAARAGAGVVTVASDKEALPVYQNAFLSIMAKPIKNPNDFYRFIENKKVNTVLIGPGNGTNQDTSEKAIECLLNKHLKVVLDADAISVFENNQHVLLENLHPNSILTPHEGEFKRIFEWKNSHEESALLAAKKSNAIIVLKGHETIIASPEGQVVVNKNAPSTLATAGTGDVLAGIISGLFAQGMPAFDAACAGVHIHSEAANKLGGPLMAEDLLSVIPKILQSL